MSLSPYHRRTPLREDSVCKLLENSCDLSDDDIDDDDEEIELLVEEGQAPIFIRRNNDLKNKKSVKSTRNNHEDFFSPSKHFTLSNEDDDDDLSLNSQRDSFPLGAGCLPCTPKSSKKSQSSKHFCPKHGQNSNSSNWCCGVVANTVKKTTKKL